MKSETKQQQKNNSNNKLRLKPISAVNALDHSLHERRDCNMACQDYLVGSMSLT